jgi:hypothetical protein
MCNARDEKSDCDLSAYDRAGLTGWEVAFAVSVVAAFVGLVIRYA